MTHVSRTPPDRDLVAAAQTGDQRALAALIERHFGAIFGIALARLGDRERAEDLAQEVSLRVALSLNQLSDSDRFLAWACQITRNLALDWIRVSRRRSELVPMVTLDGEVKQVADTNAQGARERMEAEQQERAVHTAIAKLPPVQREVVMLHAIEGLSQSEVAQCLGLSQSAVSRHFRHALQTMMGMLEPMLRDARPALGSSRTAAARAGALVVAVSAMSATAKASLAAAASLSPALTTGGKIMATGKGIITTITAGGALVLGALLVTGQESEVVSDEAAEVTSAFTNSLGMQLTPIPAGTFMMGLSQQEMDQWMEIKLPSARQMLEDFAENLERESGGDQRRLEQLLREHELEWSPNWVDEMTAQMMARERAHYQRTLRSHPVTLNAFHIGVHEVTESQYQRFLEATGHQAPEGWRSESSTANCPVHVISWEDANAFCEWLSDVEEGIYSLPTEAQWEYACRAGTTTLYYTGETITPNDALFNIVAPDFSVNPVGGYPPNPWGLHDMCGNVAEWCLDWYSDDFYDSPEATLPNPINEHPSGLRVWRGGNCSSEIGMIASAIRGSDSPDPPVPIGGVGFRVVWRPEGATAGNAQASDSVHLWLDLSPGTEWTVRTGSVTFDTLVLESAGPGQILLQNTVREVRRNGAAQDIPPEPDMITLSEDLRFVHAESGGIPRDMLTTDRPTQLALFPGGVPEGPVRVGDTWTREDVHLWGDRLRPDATSRLDRVETVNGQRLAVITDRLEGEIEHAGATHRSEMEIVHRLWIDRGQLELTTVHWRGWSDGRQTFDDEHRIEFDYGLNRSDIPRAPLPRWPPPDAQLNESWMRENWLLPIQERVVTEVPCALGGVTEVDLRIEEAARLIPPANQWGLTEVLLCPSGAHLHTLFLWEDGSFTGLPSPLDSLAGNSPAFFWRRAPALLPMIAVATPGPGRCHISLRMTIDEEFGRDMQALLDQGLDSADPDEFDRMFEEMRQRYGYGARSHP